VRVRITDFGRHSADPRLDCQSPKDSQESQQQDCRLRPLLLSVLLLHLGVLYEVSQQEWCVAENCVVVFVYTGCLFKRQTVLTTNIMVFPLQPTFRRLFSDTPFAGLVAVPFS
jgi:hypothetical protein